MNLLKIKNLTDKKLNLVIGYPLAHSQSPLLHNLAYQYLGINSILRTKASKNIKSLVTFIKNKQIEFTAVTMPYKKEILPYLDIFSDEVRILKSANTIIQREGKLYGYNTDIYGISYALDKINLNGKNALIIGAGGTARVFGHYLKNNNCNLIWTNRTLSNAIKLANELGGETILMENTKDIFPDLIINTTPVGLYPHTNKLPIDYKFTDKQIVFDIIYHPIQTAFLINAKNSQAKIISGLEMFIGQGLKQIELLTKKNLIGTPFVEKLKIALIENQSIQA